MGRKFNLEKDPRALSKWRKDVELRMREAAIESVADLAAEATRLAPRDTGYLRTSLRVTHGYTVKLATPFRRKTRKQREAAVASGRPSVRKALADLKLGDQIMLQWKAHYGGFVHRGTRGRKGRPFVRQAAKSWKAIVRRNAALVAERTVGKK